MVLPEGMSGITNATTAPAEPRTRRPQEAPTPFVPKKPNIIPKPFFPEEPKKRPKPEKEKKGIGKKVRAGLVALGSLLALESAGATATELTDREPFLNNPAYTTQIGGPLQKAGYDMIHPLDWVNNISSREANVPSSFDNNLKDSVMEVGVNSKPLDDEEIGRIKDDISIVPEKTLPTLTFLMPFLLVEGDQVKISKTEMIVDTTDDSGNKLKPSYSYVGCLKYSGLKAGREIIPGLIDPKAKSFELFKFPSVNRDGQEFFGGVLIRIERTDGIKYQISFIAPDDRRSLASLDIANNAPLADPDKNKFLSQKGVEITGTTSIMRTNIDGAIINEYMSIISMPNVSSSMPFFSEVQFFQSLDKKALYIPKK